MSDAQESRSSIPRRAHNKVGAMQAGVSGIRTPASRLRSRAPRLTEGLEGKCCWVLVLVPNALEPGRYFSSLDSMWAAHFTEGALESREEK